MEIKGNEREYFVERNYANFADDDGGGGNFGRKLLDLLDYVNSLLPGAPQCRRNRTTSPIAILVPKQRRNGMHFDGTSIDH